MSSASQPLRQSGIYRNLPTFDPKIKGLKAIVCGATGITGIHTIRALLDTPDRWSKVYALSRSQLSEEILQFLTEEQRARLQHISIDLSAAPEETAKTFKDHGVDAEYVFYFAYLQPRSEKSAMDPSTAEDLVESNVPPFKNFLASLPLAGIKPKRILLQTGGKNYGMHIGRVRTPVVESDQQPRHLGPNFYYPQEDALHEFCKQHPETDWNITMPAGVIGSTQHTSMNTMVSFAMYASVQAYRQESLKFGGSWQSWQFETMWSTARMIGYLAEWAVLEDKCKNQRFNAVDGSLLSWERFFEEVARWYGVDKVHGPEEDESKYFSVPTKGGKEAPMGYGPPIDLKLSYKLSGWADDTDAKKTWDDIMKQSNGQLKENVFGDKARDLLLMGDFAYLPFGTLCENKARRFGFNGFVDTLESIFETFQEMAKLGILPPMKVDAALPLI